MENGREMPSILGGKGERKKKPIMKLESSLDQVPSPAAELTEKVAGADSLEGSSTP